MKELSIEEKAKRYDEAIMKAKEFKDNPFAGYDGTDLISSLFPELKESEGDKIRKDLLNHLYAGANNKTIYADADDYKKWANWLEKQGSQILANSAKTCKDEQKPADKVEPKFKAGDRVIGIVSGIQYYITEVRDDYYCTELGCIIMFNAQDNFELSEQKPAWSEEDETGLGDALWAIQQARTIAKNENDMGNIWYAENWLKSLKNRVQPKQEWSEEDEYNLQCCIAKVQSDIDNGRVGRNRELLTWLKSLSSKNYWKPSDEQMEVLLSEVTAWTKGCPKQIVLESLYNDLKKLKS